MRIDCALPNIAIRRLGTDAAKGSDNSLISAIAKGDKLSLTVLYARHNVRVYRFALRLTRDESLAEDVVSEVFLDAWRGANNFQSKSKVSTWLLAIAHNKAKDAQQRGPPFVAGALQSFTRRASSVGDAWGWATRARGRFP
jgi:DNA-directed RNA polymerase specialized sigma24 family protein